MATYAGAELGLAQLGYLQLGGAPFLTPPAPLGDPVGGRVYIRPQLGGVMFLRPQLGGSVYVRVQLAGDTYARPRTAGTIFSIPG